MDCLFLVYMKYLKNRLGGEDMSFVYGNKNLSSAFCWFELLKKCMKKMCPVNICASFIVTEQKNFTLSLAGYLV